MKFTLIAALAFASFSAMATNVVLKTDKGVETATLEVVDLQFTPNGIELFSKDRAICLITGEFLRSNNIDGFQVRSLLFTAPWIVECKTSEMVPAGAVATRMYFTRLGEE